MTIEKVIQEIRHLFISQGDYEYFGENVSQYEHAAQTAMLAAESGFDTEVQVAAFLHDIGHLLPAQSLDQLMDIYGRKNHEGVAAEWLRTRGFSEKVIALVKNHVNAKRYLTLINPDYYENLSEASKKTLEFQGGRMTIGEAVEFESNPYLKAIISMRRWDEAAKVPNKKIPDLDYFLKLCSSVLTQNYHQTA